MDLDSWDVAAVGRWLANSGYESAWAKLHNLLRLSLFSEPCTTVHMRLLLDQSRSLKLQQASSCVKETLCQPCVGNYGSPRCSAISRLSSIVNMIPQAVTLTPSLPKLADFKPSSRKAAFKCHCEGLVEKFQRELIDGQALQRLSVSDLLIGAQ